LPFEWQFALPSVALLARPVFEVAEDDLGLTADTAIPAHLLLQTVVGNPSGGAAAL
jgi:hypothetical protein